MQEGGGRYDVSTSATQCIPPKEEGEAAMGCLSCLSQVTGGSSTSYENGGGGGGRCHQHQFPWKPKEKGLYFMPAI